MAALGSCRFQGTPAPRESVTIAVRADVTGFFPNPPIVNEGYTFDVNWHIFEGLVRLDRNLEIQPALAERWENPDDRTLPLHWHRIVRRLNATRAELLSERGSGGFS